MGRSSSVSAEWGEWHGDKRKQAFLQFSFSLSSFVYKMIVVAKCDVKWDWKFLKPLCLTENEMNVVVFFFKQEPNILTPSSVKKLQQKTCFVQACQITQHHFIAVLCKIFIQICNLFLYLENTGVLWISVKVLNRTVFTVIIYVSCHL